MICYKFIVFYFIFTATRIHADEKSFPACEELFQPEVFEKSCCKTLGTLEEMTQKTNSECKPKPGTEWSCKESTCVMEKEGLLENGKINEDKVNAMLDKASKDNPDHKIVVDRVRANCLKGQYKMYPLKECESMQFQLCSYMTALVECKSWKDGDECKAVSESAAKCRVVFDEAIKQKPN